MRYRIYPYKMGSRSATDLARALGGMKVYPDRNFRPRPHHFIINWGSAREPDWYEAALDRRVTFLNDPVQVNIASNKLLFLRRMSGAGSDDIIPEYTTDPAIARNWLYTENAILARDMLRASGGRGIRLYVPGEYDRFIHSPRAPLYVKYFKKRDEYRVHVAGGDVLHIQHKRARTDIPREERNYQVRNYEEGWVFCIQDVEAPPCVVDAALRAVRACGLDFGAADVAYNSHYDRAVVLEVNTACGLQAETTLRKYTDYFRNINNV